MPGVGPLLVEQFAAVGEPDEYRLPDGRILVDQSDGRAGVDAVAALTDTGNPRIPAVAFLTHLCPNGGVEETFTTAKGATYKEHFPCELDFSLVILYPRGSTPDPQLDLDVTRWAKASIESRVVLVVPDRKLLLKRFVRVLTDGPLDLSVPDEVLPRTPNPRDGLQSLLGR